jgi:hypothetical protein
MAHNSKAPAFRYIGPVTGVKVYKNDVVVTRAGNGPPIVDTPRGEIVDFSRKARQRLAFIAANTDVVFPVMFTLTYPDAFPSDGRKVKSDLAAFLAQLKRDEGAFSYLWCLEFQARGAPHIHLWTSFGWPRTRQHQKALRFRTSANWYRIVGSKDPNHLAAGTRVERVRKINGAARYAVKEMAKMYQKIVPREYRNVGRFYGYSRDVVPVMRCEMQCTEDDIRATLDGWRYAPKDDRMVWKVLYGVSGRFLEHHKE